MSDPTFLAATTSRTEERDRWVAAIRARIDAHEERLADGTGILLPRDVEPWQRRAIEERVRGARDELRSLLKDMGIKQEDQ
jgi:hypothetical protein